ncbi:Hypothetical protein BRZCDTV_518 [Brazilian cedratvirus IHUMI]|uniref:Uncharacterized protein n=1 Tax=Brazilian cedratvirus IHUMI TaxID=2126980 RepID=A0A2R8FFL9_9VIRU|nr:Hypothetical protein BRZCDTV_518 [Brazilian cedratvirus IHUMI]
MDSSKDKSHEQCSVETSLVDRYCVYFNPKYNKEACAKAVDTFAACMEHRKTMYQVNK